MKKSQLILAVAASALLAGCAAAPLSNTASRNAPLSSSTNQAGLASAYAVTQLNIVVPSNLKVSEKNVIFPNADIVWRGDAPGNRHQQVEKILKESLGAGVATLNSGRPAIVDIELQRFHSLTDRARYMTATNLHNHSIKFKMYIRDAQTGELIEERKVDGSLKAFAGYQAIAAEQRGETQKVRISRHLTQLIRQELGARPI